MRTDRQLDERISSWLEAEAPMQLPDRVLRATFERTRRTRQQAGWRALLERLNVNRLVFALGGVAVVVVIAALALGLYVNNPRSGFGGPGAAPTVSQAPTTGPSATPESTATPRPTSMPEAGVPEGPFVVDDPAAPEGAPLITVTIPASGWTFDPRFSVLEKGEEVANLPEAAILLWGFPPGTAFYVYGDPCRATSTTPDTPVTSIDAIAAGLAAQASRDASEPVDVTVGGHAGKSITLHVPDDASPDECEGGEFASYGTEEDAFARTHQGPGQIDELWIVDVDGAFVIIDAMYRPDTPAELVEEMRAIAESATFPSP